MPGFLLIGRIKWTKIVDSSMNYLADKSSPADLCVFSSFQTRFSRGSLRAQTLLNVLSLTFVR